MKLWLFDIWKDVSKKYGFEEYDAPVVEHIELYTRKAGEEVSQQLYEFEDKSGRRLSLRPEMTPSLARMITAKRGSLRFPLKWFSIPQCWRYERSTRGRRRYIDYSHLSFSVNIPS
jgi:histidyl-tRNA synthetase